MGAIKAWEANSVRSTLWLKLNRCSTLEALKLPKDLQHNHKVWLWLPWIRTHTGVADLRNADYMKSCKTRRLTTSHFVFHIQRVPEEILTIARIRASSMIRPATVLSIHYRHAGKSILSFALSLIFWRCLMLLAFPFDIRGSAKMQPCLTKKPIAVYLCASLAWRCSAQWRRRIKQHVMKIVEPAGVN